MDDKVNKIFLKGFEILKTIFKNDIINDQVKESTVDHHLNIFFPKILEQACSFNKMLFNQTISKLCEFLEKIPISISLFFEAILSKLRKKNFLKDRFDYLEITKIKKLDKYLDITTYLWDNFGEDFFDQFLSILEHLIIPCISHHSIHIKNKSL